MHMHAVDDVETVTIAGLELMRVEYQPAPDADRHDNVWAVLRPRPLTPAERGELDAWATRTGAVLLG